MKTRFPAALRDLYDDVRARPGRVGLSFLALAVGMTALTVLLAVLGGLAERSRRIVEELGVNVVATQESLQAIRQWRLRAGRFLDATDLRTRERSAVISASLADRWNWNVGQVIQLRDMPFRVVGILSYEAGALAAESDTPALTPGEFVVWVPLTVPPYWLSSRIPPEPEIDALFIQAPDGEPLDRVVARTRILLQQPDLATPALSYITPDVLLEKVRRLQRTIQVTVGSIALLCLLLGGTTLMSLMVANVRDRVTEIGLRRALGATRGDIAQLFVLESVLVTLAAALAGSGGTWILLYASRTSFPAPLDLQAETVIIPLLVAIGLGTLFSYAPARSAAAISPAEALRNE